MFDYKLKVFHTVAIRLSFSKAAEELRITQPAVTRHIKQIEAHFNQKLFDRQGNSICLTNAGEILLMHAKLISGSYEELQFDMNSLIEHTEGVLRIAASTTIAQYILPEILSKFHQKFPNVKITMINQNTAEVERSILDKSVELGFIEGRSKNREIAYTPFLEDEIVLVVAKGHPIFRREKISLEELKSISILLREQGSGTLQVTLESLNRVGLKLEDLSVIMNLGSSESIKTFLMDGKTAAFLSIHTIMKELISGDLFIVDVDTLEIRRDLHYAVQQGHPSALSSLFVKFLTRHYNK
ncbi:LysR substrate-binding domain-containing protein [Gillisia sp. M10.2A]|uniref:LysR substrate-binding domain-containing protein n=1 Tax=Gillisia lutea TaxID=2909668 RepID=A0ABS9EF94_9FLAO|nr:LysR substrate-binding domain-containing protein [Gillisia lutea]MCF4101545.1 LysR substrate-binding domain-containing protein [Gillisia lutea]